MGIVSDFLFPTITSIIGNCTSGVEFERQWVSPEDWKKLNTNPMPADCPHYDMLFYFGPAPETGIESGVVNEAHVQAVKANAAAEDQWIKKSVEKLLHD